MSGPNGEPHVPLGGAGGNDDDDDDGDSFGEEEYAAINSMLDQIDSCLDYLEEKNDSLHACLKELLESNRQARLEFQQQSEQQNTEADAQGSQPPA
ncbi:bublin coiled-coil protein [Rhynochetos jubatus]